jgi:DNA-binding CsgD family transcriptional regulator
MRGRERLSALIGDIYDAALDPSRWEAVLSKSAEFVQGAGAALWGRSINPASNPYYDVGVSPRYKKLYFEEYFRLDPLGVAYFFLDVGEVVSSSNIVPYDEFVETRFYKEWARPQGFVDNVAVLLEKSATSFAGFAVFRHERNGLGDEPARHRMRLICPHVRRAVLIGKVVELKTTEAATFAETLDGLSAGMFLVDADARLVHANAAGQSMLATADFLHAAGGRLVAIDAQADHALRDAFTAAGNGDAAVGIKGIAVPLPPRDGERHVAHVLPLTSGERRRTGTSYRAVAALFVHKAALETPSPPEVIARAYKLTPMELRVLLAVVEIGGVPDVAEALGISAETAKTHLGHVYEKTGANRQADLVKLVAGFSSPIRGPT